jgi:hypothetical protein
MISKLKLLIDKGDTFGAHVIYTRLKLLYTSKEIQYLLSKECKNAKDTVESNNGMVQENTEVLS